MKNQENKSTIHDLQRLHAHLSSVEEMGRRIKNKVEVIFENIRRLHDDHNVVRFHDLNETPKLQWFPLADGVQAIHIPALHDSLLFVMKIDEQCRLTWHYHDCHERLTLLSGGLIVNDQYRVLKTLEIYPFQRHEFYAPDGALLHLEMFR